MKHIEIEDIGNGQRVVSGVSDIFEDCPLVIRAGNRAWHAANYGQNCTFRATIDGPGEVSVWRRNERVFPEPEPEVVEPEAEPEAEAEAEAEPEAEAAE